MYLNDFLFLNRNWGNDKRNFLKTLKRISKENLPLAFLIFPEGVFNNKKELLYVKKLSVG